MNNIISMLLKARDVAHVHHWKVKSFSLHIALGELYEALQSMTDDLAEMYFGRFGTEGDIDLGPPLDFDLKDPVMFVRQLDSILDQSKSAIPQEGFLINKFEELQGMVSKIKYKVQNLA